MQNRILPIRRHIRIRLWRLSMFHHHHDLPAEVLLIKLECLGTFACVVHISKQLHRLPFFGAAAPTYMSDDTIPNRHGSQEIFWSGRLASPPPKMVSSS